MWWVRSAIPITTTLTNRNNLKCDVIVHNNYDKSTPLAIFQAAPSYANAAQSKSALTPAACRASRAEIAPGSITAFGSLRSTQLIRVLANNTRSFTPFHILTLPAYNQFSGFKLENLAIEAQRKTSQKPRLVELSSIASTYSDALIEKTCFTHKKYHA
jgi:hypothetical protein